MSNARTIGIVIVIMLNLVMPVVAETLGPSRRPILLSEQPNLETIEDINKWVTSKLPKKFGLTNGNTLEQTQPPTLLGTTKIVSIRQYFNGYPLVGSDSKVVLNNEGQPSVFFGSHTNIQLARSSAEIKTTDALMSQLHLALNGKMQKKTVYWPDAKGEYHLALAVTGDFIDDKLRYQPATLYIDKFTGEELERISLLHPSMHRTVYDFSGACKKLNITYPLITPIYEKVERLAVTDYARTETSPSSQNDTIEKSFALLGDSYTFIEEILGMASIDDNDIPLKMFVNVYFQEKLPTIQCYGKTFNAVWMPHKQSLYMPKSGIDYIEIMMHELAHGIVSNGSNLEYQFQSGALNESIADAIGVSFRIWMEHTNKNKTGSSIPHNFWQLRLPNIIARDMSDPQSLNDASLRYPDHMDNYLAWPKAKDNGGVHYNSSIINLAFYLLAEGGAHPRRSTTLEVNGIGVFKAAKIFAESAAKLLVEKSDFEDARYKFAQSAELLYGVGSQEWISVHQAMDAVGIAGFWEVPQQQEEQEPQTPPEPEKEQQPKQEPVEKAETLPIKWIILFVFGGSGLIIAIVALIKMKPRSDTQQPIKVNQPAQPSNVVVPQTPKPPQPVASHSPSFATNSHKNYVITPSAAKASFVSSNQLYLTSPDGQQIIPLDENLLVSEEGVILGRAIEVCHIQLDDKNVSRRHLRLRKVNKQIVIEDLHSSRGTWVNKLQVMPFKPKVLGLGQTLKIAIFDYLLHHKK